MMHVDLPWPSRDLHPNARVHWVVRAKAAKKARADAMWAARAAFPDPLVADALRVTAVFSPPDSRRRDLDGMLTSIKPALDGISDVIGVDDSRWDIAIKRAKPRQNGNVRIEIEVAE